MSNNQDLDMSKIFGDNPCTIPLYYAFLYLSQIQPIEKIVKTALQYRKTKKYEEFGDVFSENLFGKNAKTLEDVANDHGYIILETSSSCQIPAEGKLKDIDADIYIFIADEGDGSFGKTQEIIEEMIERRIFKKERVIYNISLKKETREYLGLEEDKLIEDLDKAVEDLKKKTHYIKKFREEVLRREKEINEVFTKEEINEVYNIMNKRAERINAYLMLMEQDIINNLRNNSRNEPYKWAFVISENDIPVLKMYYPRVECIGDTDFILRTFILARCE